MEYYDHDVEYCGVVGADLGGVVHGGGLAHYLQLEGQLEGYCQGSCQGLQQPIIIRIAICATVGDIHPCGLLCLYG